MIRKRELPTGNDTEQHINLLLQLDQENRPSGNLQPAKQALMAAGIQAVGTSDRLPLLHNIWDRTRQIIKQPGHPEHDTVYTPKLVLKATDSNPIVAGPATAALFIGYALTAYEIPYSYRFAGYREGGQIQHAYVVAHLDGQQIVLDPQMEAFDTEYPVAFSEDRLPVT